MNTHPIKDEPTQFAEQATSLAGKKALYDHAAARTWDKAIALQRENGQMKLALLKILAIADPPLEAERESMAQDLDNILVACWEGLADD